MTKQILNVAIVAAVFAAMCGTAYARVQVPDAGSTSALLLLAAVALGVVRKFIR